MNQIVGESSCYSVMTTKRREIEKQVQEKSQAIFDQFKLGIKIRQVIIINALPPPKVNFALNEINRASQDVKRLTYLAEIDYMTIIPKTKGEEDKLKTYENSIPKNSSGMIFSTQSEFLNYLNKISPNVGLTSFTVFNLDVSKTALYFFWAFFKACSTNSPTEIPSSFAKLVTLSFMSLDMFFIVQLVVFLCHAFLSLVFYF